ncbi:MAG: peroxidase [candidate division Zixibacteria bacterium]|nr:peroxidase [candidate division Zixibacteria bacterium]
MAWIKKIPVGEAEGRLKTIFDGSVKRAGKVYQIVHLQSLNAPVLQAALEMYRAAMFGPSPLSRQQREMIGTVVSSINHCHY